MRGLSVLSDFLDLFINFTFFFFIFIFQHFFLPLILSEGYVVRSLVHSRQGDEV